MLWSRAVVVLCTVSARMCGVRAWLVRSHVVHVAHLCVVLEGWQVCQYSHMID
jgi:hypothetical protein